MRLLIDTNRYTDVIANDVETAARMQQAEEVWLSLITVGELLAGFAYGSRRQANERRLEQLLAVQGVGLLLPDLETARHFARISSELRAQGTPIPTNDMWIAAQAVQHDLTLDTRDSHFRSVPGLTLV